MASLNKVLLMGNLTRDPEVRVASNGLKIAKLGMAVNRRYRTRENELKEETTFVDVDAFGQQAEVLERYCQKGTPLFVEGRLRLDQWQGKDGENRSKLTVVLEGFQFLGAGRAADSGPRDEDTAADAAPRSTGKSSSGSLQDDDFKDDENAPF